VNLLCPACRTALPAGAEVVICPACAVEVDVTRAGTLAGRPRFVPEIDRTGTVVRGYQVEARIGGGGMGTVYRAVDPEGKKVALKFLSPALAQDPVVVARFAREVTTLARLRHPAIVAVLDQGEEGGLPWFAMELVEGPDLRARLAAGPLAPAETAAIFGRLLQALAHAHAAGVVHRDLKPANVLLAADGARLADFGIARWEGPEATGAGALTRLTETAAVIGTLPYMSPEQRRGGPTDARSDLFSVGVMLYEAATGALPHGAFPAASEVNGAYGRPFDRVVLDLLRSDPAQRTASAATAAAALARALAPSVPRRWAVAVAAALALAAGTTDLGLRALHHRPAVTPTAPVAAAPPPVAIPSPSPSPSPDTPRPSPATSPPSLGDLETIWKGGQARPKTVRSSGVSKKAAVAPKEPLDFPSPRKRSIDEKLLVPAGR
jgi:eukaryotic-like serine/threonine-protein kinase